MHAVIGDQRADSSDQEPGTAGRQEGPIQGREKLELDEEIEGEEEEAQHEEEGTRGKVAMWEAADGMKKAGGNYAEARFGSGEIKRTDGFVAGQIPAEGGKLIFHPEREFFAIAPQIE
jgi:hypothetical protein